MRMAREQLNAEKGSEESLLDRRSYLRLASSAVAAVATGTGVAASSDSSSSPTVDRFTISKSEPLGSNQMFVVKWGIADADEDLDVVEVAVTDGNSDLDFSVEDVSGASASGWEMFQFPTDRTLDVHLRAKDSAGNVTKNSQSVTLGNGGSSGGGDEADIHVPFDDSSDLDRFQDSPSYDNLGHIANAPSRDGDALKVPIPEGSHQGDHQELHFDDHLSGEPEEAYAEFYLYIPESFQYVDSGPGGAKIGGFAGLYDAGTGYACRPVDGTDAWSARMFNLRPDRAGVSEDHGLGYYVYHADQGGNCGDELSWDFGINTGEWCKIGQHIRMNTPGANDGVLRGWIDDELAFERENFRFRRSGYENIKIEQFLINVYHGGSWTCPNDTAIYFDDLKVKENANSL